MAQPKIKPYVIVNNEEAPPLVPAAAFKLLYDGMILHVCKYFQVLPSDVENREYKARSVRPTALYLLNVSFQIGVRDLSRVAGLSPSGVSQAINGVEQKRNHPADDDFIRKISLTAMGVNT